MNTKQNKTILTAIILIAVVFAAIVIGIASMFKTNIDNSRDPFDTQYTGKSLDELVSNVKYTEAGKVMGQITMTDSNLYDELPEISKYPVQVQGKGQIDIEIFTSGEKAGSGNDAWMIKTAEKLNKAGLTLQDGRSVSLTVRSMGSGIGADYILSGKALPDLYNPSNQLFGDYAIANGAPMKLLSERLVGNTAGILVRKDMDYKDPDAIINAVINGELHLGYTNPQNSATGANLLVYLLQKNGGVDSDTAKQALQNFNANIPFIAYTTQQMVTSAASGSFDAILTEYQAYINDQNLTSLYDFIPFGLRHDNPVYITGKASSDAARTEAVDIVLDYLNNAESQALAKSYGFNANDDYNSSYETYGAEVGRALAVYKQAKDAGRDIIAVFVADCSGSMDGSPILELKDSLSNGMQYINDNNYIGLVSYSTQVTLELPIAKFDMTQKAYFQGALDRMQASGNTATYEAVCVAMDMIRQAKENNPDAKAMLFLLSDGDANGRYSISDVKKAVHDSEIPIYTIAYTGGADSKELSELSGINEATCINADSDDIVYKIKSLFNAQL